MKKLAWITTGLAIAAATGMGVGCGGGVTVEGQGGAGGGTTTASGTGSTTGTGNTTGSQSTSVSSASSMSTTSSANPSTTASGPSPGICADVCAKGAMLGCEVGSGCEQECQAAIAEAGMCADELVALYDCIVDAATSCQLTECAAEEMALNACDTGPSTCDPTECGGTGSGGFSECFCSQQCEFATFEVSCKSGGGQPTTCACSVNGMQVGQCTENGPPTCDIQSGCCSMFFDQPGGG